METKCLECGTTFDLDFMNVYIGISEWPPHGNIVVIKCPHCKKRKEI